MRIPLKILDIQNLKCHATGEILAPSTLLSRFMMIVLTEGWRKNCHRTHLSPSSPLLATLVPLFSEGPMILRIFLFYSSKMTSRSIFATILVAGLSGSPQCCALSSRLPWTRLSPRNVPCEPCQHSPRDFHRSLSSLRMQEHNSDWGEGWLERTTNSLLDTEPGSLVKGKWHQLLSMMTAWSKRAEDDRNAPLVMERLLKRAIDEHRAGNAECFPTTQFYNFVIDAWAAWANASDHGKLASRRARQILHWLQRTYDVEQDPERRPNAHSFHSVLKAVAKTEKPQVALGMLKWREQLYNCGQNPDAKPPPSAYVTVLDAFANSGMEDVGEQAEDLLKQMTAAGVEPSTLCYNIAIKAWIKSGRGRQSAEYSERILEEMQPPPDVVTYSSVIHAWATSGVKEYAAERAEAILQRLEMDESAEANVVAYNACLNAWCKSKSPMAVNRTEALLARMEASEHVAPDLVSYNTHIYAMAMAGYEEGMAQRADATLCRLEEQYDKGEVDYAPNLFSYNLVIEGWARSRDPNAATRACDVLRKLVKRDGVEPDAISFNQVINALSRSTLPGAAQKAEDLLHYMDESYKSGVYECKADVVGYTSAITAWSRSGENGGAERAERLLVEMEQRYLNGEMDLKPTTAVYNAVIDAWAKSGEGTLGARRAEALLQRMQEMLEAGDHEMQPNIITYNAVLNAWAKSGTRCCAHKAEGYVNKMWELYEAGNTQVKPDGKSYNTVSHRRIEAMFRFSWNGLLTDYFAHANSADQCHIQEQE